MKHAGIRAIAEYLPEQIYDNAALARDFPALDPRKVLAKVGIARRTIAAKDEFASDMACAAVEKLFASGACERASIDYLIYCTQAPDYPLPTTACLLQSRLGLAPHIGAIDVNLGCSGYIYALGLASALIEAGQVRQALVITADTYSKFMAADDNNVRTIFGDGAAATLVTAGDEASFGVLGPWRYGTDGKGAGNLIVRDGLRGEREKAPEKYLTAGGTERFGQPLRMNGPEIFAFTLKAVPALVKQLLDQAGLTLGDIDLFVFHQANSTMLDALRKRLAIPEDRFVVDLENQGNIVSASIPIALARCIESKRFRPGMKAALIGYGVGYSWAGTLLEWPASGVRKGVR
jgi:3-oxoacyl-[acyl-carrier-protein] synthase III